LNAFFFWLAILKLLIEGRSKKHLLAAYHLQSRAKVNGAATQCESAAQQHKDSGQQS
jgi:hypothetical protein